MFNNYRIFILCYNSFLINARSSVLLALYCVLMLYRWFSFFVSNSVCLSIFRTFFSFGYIFYLRAFTYLNHISLSNKSTEIKRKKRLKQQLLLTIGQCLFDCVFFTIINWNVCTVFPYSKGFSSYFWVIRCCCD